MNIGPAMAQARKLLSHLRQRACETLRNTRTAQAPANAQQNLRNRLYNALFLAFAFVALVYAMYPGHFDGDAIAQYGQGVAGTFDDSHSVLDAALMGGLSGIAKGAGPTFVLQLALWVGGLWVFTDTLIKSGYRVAGQAVSLLALTPLLSFDFFYVQKDALVSGLLAVLIAIGTRIVFGRAVLTLIGSVAVFCLVVLAMDSRQNAFFALIPLWLLAWPVRRLRLRDVLACAGAGLIFFGAAAAVTQWVDYKALKANRSELVFGLFIYDLAGIAARTGKDASEGMLPDFQANVAACYSPKKWDDFRGGPCHAVGTEAERLVHDRYGRTRLAGQWIKQIVLHPIAYSAHRVCNYGCLMRVDCYDDPIMNFGATPLPWDEPGARTTAAGRVGAMVAENLWRGPLGFGVLWLLILVAEFAVAIRQLWRTGFSPLAYLVMTLSATGLCYAASFGVVGLADQLRYLHPVIFLAILAGPLTGSLMRPSSDRHEPMRPVDAPAGD